MDVTLGGSVICCPLGPCKAMTTRGLCSLCTKYAKSLPAFSPCSNIFCLEKNSFCLAYWNWSWVTTLVCNLSRFAFAGVELVAKSRSEEDRSTTTLSRALVESALILLMHKISVERANSLKESHTAKGDAEWSFSAKYHFHLFASSSSPGRSESQNGFKHQECGSLLMGMLKMIQ